jgi:hypothetical protein
MLLLLLLLFVLLLLLFNAVFLISVKSVVAERDIVGLPPPLAPPSPGLLDPALRLISSLRLPVVCRSPPDRSNECVKRSPLLRLSELQ